MTSIETTFEKVKEVYKRSSEKNLLVKKHLQKPLTFTEKILFGHLKDIKNQDFTRGQSFLLLYPDRVALQDATAQMALLQFMLAERDTTAIPTTVHCDHLILAYEGIEKDMPKALEENREVFDFLSSVSHRYKLGFWKPGAGIIHQVVLENYAFPGGLLIGTDSHTPNAGGLAMIASGVGGADAAEVMAGLPWEVRNPQIVGVHLKGELSGWSSPKDVILKLCGLMTVKGGTNKIIEYFGDGCSSISCTGKATITNMGAELGATCSVFPFDSRMSDYLKATKRADLAQLATTHQENLKADAEVLQSPEKFYDEIIEIDLSSLEPQLVGPHSPDATHPLNEIKELAQKNKWPVKLSAALIGSCTNSSYEDIGAAVDVAQQALTHNHTMPQQFMVSPGSAQIKNTIERDGYMATLKDVGATVLSNACGPCIGQWKRTDFKKGEANTIVNSFNRNFPGRNDANAETLSFIASPQITMALGLAGRLDFDPRRDELVTKKGESIKLKAPVAEELPANGFASDPSSYQEPKNSDNTQVSIDPKSERLQFLAPFAPWNGEDFKELLVLCKVSGKCTTDHISPAGLWLKFRGHLDNISNNLLLGARNAFSPNPGHGLDVLKNEKNKPLNEIARNYKNHQKPWVIIGDDNYGEGSSREHAAMSPRFLGAQSVIAKSFARIHENNLKRQGVLALTFNNPKDYDKISSPTDRVSILGLADLAPKKSLKMLIHHENGSTDEAEVSHSFNADQIYWFKAGSSLNYQKASDA